MNSTPAEFEALMPAAGLSFEDFGNATQADLDKLKTLWFPNDVLEEIKLQSLWARHPIRQGEGRQYLHVIAIHSFSMLHFIAQITYERIICLLKHFTCCALNPMPAYLRFLTPIINQFYFALNL